MKKKKSETIKCQRIEIEWKVKWVCLKYICFYFFRDEVYFVKNKKVKDIACHDPYKIKIRLTN